jgi:hypothetical protein
MTSPLERLAGTGKPLAAEPPDTKEFEGLKRSGLARLKDATMQRIRSRAASTSPTTPRMHFPWQLFGAKDFGHINATSYFKCFRIHSASVLRSGVCWTSATRFGIWVNTKVTSISMSASLPI